MAVKEQDSGLRSELCAYYEWGLSVMIDEKICQTEDISQICSVLEEDHYMRDYVEGKEGEITSVNFTKVSMKKERP